MQIFIIISRSKGGGQGSMAKPQPDPQCQSQSRSRELRVLPNLSHLSYGRQKAAVAAAAATPTTRQSNFHALNCNIFVYTDVLTDSGTLGLAWPGLAWTD